MNNIFIITINNIIINRTKGWVMLLSYVLAIALYAVISLHHE